MIDEEVKRRGLLKLIPPLVGNINVLLIESLSYLRELRQLLPSANILVLTESKEAEVGFSDLQLDWLFSDYKKLNLPINETLFDIIISEDCLTFAYEPYKTIFAINRWLKETGFLITQFESIRFVGVLESLRQGYYPQRERRLYAKTEVVRLLNDALFKEISFTPNESINYNVDEWIAFGFDNYNNELLVKNWIVKASRSTSEVAALKEFYSPAVRSKLLHRIEYDIDRKENIERLQDFCEEHQIFDDYLFDFIEQVVVHRDNLADIFVDDHTDNDV